MGIDKDKNSLKTASTLRRQAEDHLQGKTKKQPLPRSKEDSLRLVHELEVHRIELEMQNNELCRTQVELEVLLNTYAELYDFAPVGYFAFDPHGLIVKVNLAGAQQLGIERSLLVNRNFSDFISDENERKVFFDHLSFVLQRKSTLKCGISITKNDGEKLDCQPQNKALNPVEKVYYILSCIHDC